MQKSEMWMVAPNLCKVCRDLVGDMKQNQVYNFVLASRLKYKLFSFWTDPIAAIGVPNDYEVFWFAGAKGADELALNAGYIGVENDFGFAAEVLYCVEHQVFVVKDGFVGIQEVQFLPVTGEGIGLDAFGVVYKELV